MQCGVTQRSKIWSAVLHKRAENYRVQSYTRECSAALYKDEKSGVQRCTEMKDLGCSVTLERE